MTTTTIRRDDLIETVRAALQYISYYHPADYIAHLARAYQREQSAAAKDAIEKAERHAGYKIEGACVGVGGQHVEAINAPGVVWKWPRATLGALWMP